MAILSVPITFQIFKGNQCVRVETLNESIIKIGKLATSQLRLEDETVSRMHAVIEVVGPGQVQLIDLGSTRGTTVNGERISHGALKPGDQILFGDARVIVAFPPSVAVAEATPAPGVFVPQPTRIIPPSTIPTRPTVQEIPEGDAPDGSKAIEVRTLYRGNAIGTRYMTEATGKTATWQTRAFLGAGIACILLALATFFATMNAAGHEKAKYEKFLRDGGEAKNFPWAPGSPVLDFAAFGCIAMGIALVSIGLKRRTDTAPDFVVGSSSGADAPVDQSFIGSPSFALVSTTGTDFLVHVTPAMSGEIQVDGSTVPLPEFVRRHGPSFSLGERGLARIDCGETSFMVHATSKPRTVPVPFLTWQWSEQAYTVGTASALVLFLFMIFSVPPDPKSLSLDLFNADNRFLSFTVKPPVEMKDEIPDWLQKKSLDTQGGQGQRHAGDEGKMGKETSKKKEGLVAIQGPKDNQDQHLAKKLAEDRAKNSGILGVIRMAEGSHLASIWGRETAVGSDEANVLGGLIGSEIGEAYGVHGLGLVGTGWGGGGTGQDTLGLSTYGTFGKGGGGGDKSGYGRGVGGLAGGLGARKVRGPEIIPGQANVHGSLDKEIIRRIIRRHINEVKYCYEAELTKKANLAGRISVQFTIAGTGEVITSVLQSSTMSDVRVESCVVQAVRRWEFPRPSGGGIVIVSYPFNFTAGGTGG